MRKRRHIIMCWDCGLAESTPGTGYCDDCYAKRKAKQKEEPLCPKIPKRGTAEQVAARKRIREWRKTNPSGNFNIRYCLDRITALKHYSGGTFQCAYCGIADIDVLCLDHINGDGSIHRAQMGNQNVFTWLRLNGYSKGFQVLCRNCNHKKYLLECFNTIK